MWLDPELCSTKEVCGSVGHLTKCQKSKETEIREDVEVGQLQNTELETLI